jgi:ribosome maturation factor RimP
MNLVAHEKLTGLDREQVLAVVEPVLRAHGVEAVELIWRTDRAGWLLVLTVERPDSRRPGDGVTIELCSDISKDLSAALDVADVIPHAYRLEVGSPGLDRALYSLRDYERFAGQLAKLKLKEPLPDGQRVVEGTLHGLNESGRVELETPKELLSFEIENIESARLVFDWNTGGSKGKPTRGKNSARRASSRGR